MLQHVAKYNRIIFLKKSYLVYNEIWLNILVDDHQFGHITKYILKTINNHQIFFYHLCEFWDKPRILDECSLLLMWIQVKNQKNITWPNILYCFTCVLFKIQFLLPLLWCEKKKGKWRHVREHVPNYLDIWYFM